MPKGIGYLWSLLLVLSLSACVTTTNTPQTKVDPSKAEATHVSTGLAYLSKNKPEKDLAKRHFQKALDFNKNSAGALNGLALVYQMEGEWALTEKYFQKAISADSNFSQARNNYGAFLFAQERYDDAYKQFKLVSTDIDYDKRHLGFLNLGRAELKLGQVDNALQSLRQAVGIRYRLPSAHLELAEIYFQKKDFVQAKFYYDQFVKMARQNPRSLWLGIRIERIFGNQDRISSYAMALKNLYPYSQEYLNYKASGGQ